MGTPGDRTEAILRRFLGEFASEQLAMHMHDTRGTALANVLVGLENGVRTFDALRGGPRWLPCAPGAAGNLATEDLVFMLHGMGVGNGHVTSTSCGRRAKVAAVRFGHELSGKVHQGRRPLVAPLGCSACANPRADVLLAGACAGSTMGWTDCPG